MLVDGQVEAVGANLGHHGLVALPQGGYAQVEFDAPSIAKDDAGAFVRAVAGWLDVAGDADAVVLAVAELPLETHQAVVVQFLQHPVEGRGIVAAVVGGDDAVDAGGADGEGHFGWLNQVPAADFQGV